MEGTPENLEIEDIRSIVEELEGVEEMHHVHVWSLDEKRVALEAHIVVITDELKEVELIKGNVKLALKEEFDISHSTLEFEHHQDTNCEEKA